MLNRIEAKLRKFSQSFFYFLIYSTGFLVFVSFLRFRVEGKENIPRKGRFILAANHQNFFDGWFLASTIGSKRITFVIAKRVLKLKFFQILAQLIGAVLIGNELEEYQNALKRLNKTLTHGGPVGIFPEGDISSHELPRRFKGGVAKLSLDSKTKVVPVYINGTYNLRYFSYWLKRPEILIKVGKPIELYNYAQHCGNNLDQMAEVLREKIIGLSNVKEENESETSNCLAQESYTTPAREQIVEELGVNESLNIWISFINWLRS